MRCGWSSAFTHLTVEPALTVISAGLKALFIIVIVLSDTEAVIAGVITGAVGGGVINVTGTVEGVDTGVLTDGVEDDWVHPLIRMKHAARSTSTGSFFIPYCPQPG